MQRLRPDAEMLSSKGALIIAFLAAVFLGLIALVGGFRTITVVFGALAILLTVMVSPNPRKLILWMLVLSLPLALSKHFDEIVFKGGGEQSFRIEVYDIFVFWLLIIQFRDSVARRTKGLRIPRVTWFWVALMFLGTIDVIVGPWRTSGAHELVRMFKVALLFIVLVNELESPKQILSCAVPVALGVLLQAGVAILQYLKGGLLGLGVLGETTARTIENLAYTSIEGSLTFRPSGLLLHANILGIYFAITLPLLIAAILVERKLRTRILLVFSVGAGMTGLILSQSRSAWVGFALAYVVLLGLLLSHRRLQGRSMAVAALSSATILAVLIPFSGRVLTRLFASKSDATVGRDVFTADFYRLIQDHWLHGTGLNSYSYEVVPYLSFSVSIYHNWIPPVHNIYYLWWGETGIFGLALHVIMWGGIILAAINNLRVKDDILFAINAACLGSMFCMIFDGFLSFSLRVNQPQRLFFFVSAIIFAIHYLRRQWESRT